MKSKYKIAITILIFFIGINLFSQHHSDKLKSLKIGFLTESLDLTSEEAEKFWPIYNLHQDKIHQIRHIDTRTLKRKMMDEKDFKSLTDKEAEKLLNQLLDKEEEVTKEQSVMFKELKGILPPKKLLTLYKSENDFKRKMLQEYKKRTRVMKNK